MSQDYIHIMQCGIDPVTMKWIPPLTKREQFAMAVMQGILSNPETECSFDIDEEVTAQAAVFIADALIEELDK